MNLKNIIPALLLVSSIAHAKAQKEERTVAQTGHVGSFKIPVPILQIPCKLEELKLNASGNYDSVSGSGGPIMIGYSTYWSDRSEDGWATSAFTMKGDYVVVTANQLADTSKVLNSTDKKGMGEFKVLKSLSVVLSLKKVKDGQSFTTTDADGKLTTAHRLTCTFEK